MATKKAIYYRSWDELPVILTLEQCAIILNARYETMRKWATNGKIPAVKVAGEWRVNKEALRKMFETNVGV